MTNTHLARIASAFAIAAALFGAAFGGIAIAHADDRGMLQSEFPCQEDEVLGYAPQFGPDRVGCISVDALVMDAIADYN